jgi:hypothetical protein
MNEVRGKRVMENSLRTEATQNPSNASAALTQHRPPRKATTPQRPGLTGGPRAVGFSRKPLPAGCSCKQSRPPPVRVSRNPQGEPRGRDRGERARGTPPGEPLMPIDRAWCRLSASQPRRSERLAPIEPPCGNEPRACARPRGLAAGQDLPRIERWVSRAGPAALAQRTGYLKRGRRRQWSRLAVAVQPSLLAEWARWATSSVVAMLELAPRQHGRVATSRPRLDLASPTGQRQPTRASGRE